MSADDSLEHLMERYVAGDLPAFEALYARVSGRVLAYLLAMTRDRARAEDVLQTAFLKFHVGRAGFLPGSPVLPWIMAIARHALYDESRSKKRARVRVTETGEVPDMVDEAELAALLDRGGPPPVDLHEALALAIERLPPLQREALALTKQGSLSHRDAALALGTTETAVKLRVHRAYETLRAALQPHVEPDR